MKKICICGGGSLGHVIAGWLSARNHAIVNILTRRPDKWQKEIFVDTPDGEILKGEIDRISSKPEEVIPEADIVLLCLPGFMITKQLEAIEPVLQPSTFVGSVFSSTGFFFEAQSILSENQPLWGFQRVPFISRVNEYGKSAHLLGCWIFQCRVVDLKVPFFVLYRDGKIRFTFTLKEHNHCSFATTSKSKAFWITLPKPLGY